MPERAQRSSSWPTTMSCPCPRSSALAGRAPLTPSRFAADGRLYGRGSNDDLGSGVVASLIALAHLADGQDLPANVRLLVCCDEETGGEGGIESLRAYDATLPAGDPGRFLVADVALIPDGSPETTAGSSGVAVPGSVVRGPRAPVRGRWPMGRPGRSLHTWPAPGSRRSPRRIGPSRGARSR